MSMDKELHRHYVMLLGVGNPWEVKNAELKLVEKKVEIELGWQWGAAAQAASRRRTNGGLELGVARAGCGRRPPSQSWVPLCRACRGSGYSLALALASVHEFIRAWLAKSAWVGGAALPGRLPVAAPGACG
jgi:hypothetical protein